MSRGVRAAAVLMAGSVVSYLVVQSMGTMYGSLILLAAIGAAVVLVGGRRLRRLGYLLIALAAGVFSLGMLWFLSWGAATV